MRWNELINEGDVVDLSQHKMKNAFSDYADVIQSIMRSEQAFFKTGKFLPFAESYIRNNFDKAFAPEIVVDVNFRDVKLTPEARALVQELRADRWAINRIKWAAGHVPTTNPEGNCNWGHAQKVIDLETAKRLFAGRKNSPYGAYQKSASGMRTTHVKVWDERGVGFNITVGGEDCRRGDKYGNACRNEYHIIDDEKDMAEVAQCFALIQRARIKPV